MIELTRPGKYSLIVKSPLMNAAGILGYSNPYGDMLPMDRLGAFVTNPITYEQWSPAAGTRVVPLPAGVLMHTGLPNPGLKRVLKENRNIWRHHRLPVIVHLVATDISGIRRAMGVIEQEDVISAIELGLEDDIPWQDAERFVRAATERSEKPVLVRLPLLDAYAIADAVDQAGAAALVIGAPPRGTARDPHSGRLVSGRVYGPLVKPIALRVLSNLAGRLTDLPMIGAGGIHNPQDARDFLEAGARAVQVDSALWVQPDLISQIADDLGGGVNTISGDAWM